MRNTLLLSLMLAAMTVTGQTSKVTDTSLPNRPFMSFKILDTLLMDGVSTRHLYRLVVVDVPRFELAKRVYSNDTCYIYSHAQYMKRQMDKRYYAIKNQKRYSVGVLSDISQLFGRLEILVELIEQGY